MRPDDEVVPCPLWTSDLLGTRHGRLAVSLTLLLLALVGASRLAVLPASVWDRDEAHLGLAVLRFDPAEDRPHAPWFPLWVVVGKLGAPVASEPARALEVISAALGTWTLFPLTALLSVWMRRRLATAAALLYLALPGPWFLSARAYSDTPATFLLLLAAAWWLRPKPAPDELASGSVAALACVLVRPQLLLPVIAMGFWRWTAARRSRDRVLLLLPIGAGAVAAAIGLILAAGSGAELVGSLARHARYQLAGLATARHEVASSGLARALLLPELAVGWILLTAVGIAVWHRRRREVGSPWPLVITGLAPMVGTVLLLVDPTQARYALPALALSCGPVMVALAWLLGRWSAAAVAVCVATSVAVGLPQARALRTRPSPVISALETAGVEASAREGVVVVDRTLRVFAEYAAETGRIRSPLLNDFSIEIGAVDPPPAPRTIAVFDRGRGAFVADSEERETFRCPIAWMRRLGPDRFQEVTVAAGARVVQARTEW